MGGASAGLTAPLGGAAAGPAVEGATEGALCRVAQEERDLVHAEAIVGEQLAGVGLPGLLQQLAPGSRLNDVLPMRDLAPGPIEGTEGVRRLVPEGSADRLKKMIPLGRFGTPDDIGQLSVFLASPLASYITGALVVADGGQNLPGSGAWTQLIMAEMAKAKG